VTRRFRWNPDRHGAWQIRPERARRRAGAPRYARRLAAARLASLALGLALALPAGASAETAAFAPSGAWTYFTEPRAVNHEGRHRRTYAGWVDARGQILASSYDHRSGTRTRAVLRSHFQVDDHNNPSITVRPDGRLLAFYSGHAGDNLFYRLSRRPEDVTAWGRERRMRRNTHGPHGYTYPTPIWLARERRPLFLFWRGGNFEPAFSTSRQGMRWSRPRRLIDGQGQRPYVVFDSNGQDTIHMAFTNGHPDERTSSIFYAAYRRGGFEAADGRSIGGRGELPIEPSAADSVYFAAAGDPPAWAYDVGVGADGRPVILYATFPSPDDHRYHYARWNGVSWESFQITAAGPTIDSVSEKYYAGGLVLDSRDASVVYLSRQVDGVYQVERWSTATGGRVWARTPVSSGPSGAYRPVSATGPSFGENHDLFWMSGHYPGWRDIATAIHTRVPAGWTAPPDAAFRARRAGGGRRVRVEAEQPGAGDLSYRWRFGDGRAAGGGARATHAYRRPGTYAISLTVTDPTGRGDVFVREVKIPR
jgi:hypothetical protein